MSFQTQVSDSAIIIKNEDGLEVVRFYYIFNSKLTEDFKKVFKLHIKGPFIYISRLYVHPSYRRRGLATEVIQAMLNLFVNIDQFIVIANPDEGTEISHKHLIKFYALFDFKPIQEIDEGTLMILKR